MTIDADRINFDFRESDDQATGPYNIRPPLVRAACYYCLKCLIGSDLPSTAGLAAAVDTQFRPGSVLDPYAPAPINTYMPIAMVTAEAIFDALAAAVPRARIAESAGGGGTSGILSHASHRTGYPQVQYDLLANAMGRMLGHSRFTQRGGKQLSPAAGRSDGHPSALARTTVNRGQQEKVRWFHGGFQ